MQTITDLQSEILEAIFDKKGSNVVILDLSQLESSPAPAMIICQARSTSQVSAIADNIREKTLEKLNIKPYAYDGYRNSQWIVIDYGSVMVHVFQPETREFYRLEELWSDGEITKLPDVD